MNPEQSTFPIYRLVNQEAQSELITAEDIRGFFVSPDCTPPNDVTFTNVHSFHQTRKKTDDTELEILNHRQEKIGEYYIGPTSLSSPDPRQESIRCASLSYSFFGYRCEFPMAGEVWRRWADRDPIKLGEWERHPVEFHESWLHVAQTAWFTARRRAIRYGTDEIAYIDGSKTSTRPAFYCALGEAVNGPGGYFGSNLDALIDCLSSTRKAGLTFRVTWDRFSSSREELGEGFVTQAVDIMERFGVQVTCRG
ncbi:barstar family protein [Streptomyces kronopolitis]|uniref:barstar family protein n=1 Tax=Streptomyces kronopolitis TaxID=1612435 RepID=UPI0036D1B0C4